ncbi:MAG TPA: PIG-L deacetylase family protein [Steroidobacteraceae bacterium]|jgi:LmbE family N-acetylglucosaminyl deacetylase
MRHGPVAALLFALSTVALCSPAAPLPPMTPPSARDRVLVVAPHPDDESLCCAGLIQQALAAGASVGIVWVTAGDGFELDALVVEHTLRPDAAQMQRLGMQRLQEARQAATVLGVPPAARFVLGYPDRGIEALLGRNYQQPYRSAYTGKSQVTYPGAISLGAAYTGVNLERDLERVLEEFRPTLVFAAAPQDLHPDHRASGALIRRLLERRGQLGELRYWIVHAHQWPRPYGLHTDLPLLPPLAAESLPWRSFKLSDAQRQRKLAAIEAHASQMEIMGPLMKAFVRANELFAPAERR